MTRDLSYVCGSVISAGESVRVIERFSVNGGREFRLRIEWRGRLWQVCEEDVEVPSKGGVTRRRMFAPEVCDA